MNDREMLIRAICTNPAEDTPRLAFADWCEEHGVRWHAELIRLQCGGASDAKIRGFLRRWMKHDYAVQQMRDQFLINEHFAFSIGSYDDSFGPGRLRAFVERGFVQAVVCPLADFFAHINDIFVRHPIQRMYLTDRHSTLRRAATAHDASSRIRHGYYREDEEAEYGGPPTAYAVLPAEVFDLLPDSDPPSGVVGAYLDGEQSRNALSHACIRLGRLRRDELWARCGSSGTRLSWWVGCWSGRG